MRGDLQKMIEAFAQSGQVHWIGLRAKRRADLIPVDRVEVTANGLTGDHAGGGKRAVTVMQAEHLYAIAAFLGRDTVTPQQLRRNLIVAGINLASLKGRDVRIGGVALRFTGICAPCSRMEEVLGIGGYAAVRGHGGWCADVLTPGWIELGDPVQPDAAAPSV